MSRPKISSKKAAAIEQVFDGAPKSGPPVDPLGGFKPSDFLGVLLTDDRLMFYTSAEKRTDPTTKQKFTIFRRGPACVGVFTDDKIVIQGIEGLIPDAPQSGEAAA